MNDYITDNTVLLGAVGFFAPFILPLIFGLITKITKKELLASAKKYIVLGISVVLAGITVAFNFAWTGEFKVDILEFIKMFLVDGSVFLGMVNIVYVNIVKLFPEIDQKLETLESSITK